MKKIIRNIILSLSAVLFILPGLKAFAAEGPENYIVDNAQLLAQTEWENLEDYAAQLSRYYSCAVHIYTTDDPAVNEDNIMDYGENMYLFSGEYGWGTDKDGFLLIISMSDRSWGLLSHGQWGNYALTDYGKDYLSDQFIGNLSSDYWYGAFYDYLEGANYILDCAVKDKPVDIYVADTSKPDLGVMAYLISAVAGLITASVVCNSRLSQMRTAVTATHADEYVAVGKVTMKEKTDEFSHVRRTQSRINTGGSPQGTTVNSRGFSGKKGKF